MRVSSREGYANRGLLRMRIFQLTQTQLWPATPCGWRYKSQTQKRHPLPSATMLSLDFSFDTASFPPDVQFCAKCQYVLDHLYFRHPSDRVPDAVSHRARHHKLRTLFDSATRGCRLCLCFIRSFVDEGGSLEKLHSHCGDRPAVLHIGSSDYANSTSLSLCWYEENMVGALWMRIGAVSAAGMISFLFVWICVSTSFGQSTEA